jgi:hypothetical protein
MESNSNNTEKDNQKPVDNETKFENSSVDPGFGSEDHSEELEGREDERSGNIDVGKSIKEMRDDAENDAMNSNNDRDHGASNPKNI